MPTPHRHDFNKEAFHKYSRLSVKDRMNQVKSQLTDVEMAYLSATCINWCGMDLSLASFFDCMRWWSLAGYDPDGITHCAYSYKLKCGQTGLARAIFEDICAFDNFSYVFEAPISKISRANGTVKVHSSSPDSGDWCYTAKQLICTIPWNVLDTIDFEPSLPLSMQTCIGNVNHGHSVKVYAEVQGQEWDAWSYLAPPGNLERSLGFAATAGCTPRGNTRMVLFGLQDEMGREFYPDEEPELILDALQRIQPAVDVKRLVSASTLFLNMKSNHTF